MSSTATMPVAPAARARWKERLDSGDTVAVSKMISPVPLHETL